MKTVTALWVILFGLMAAGCEKKPCLEVEPAFKFEKGEKAIHLVSGDEVRVISIWARLNGGECEKVSYGRYTVRFDDGAKIAVKWDKLRKIDRK